MKDVLLLVHDDEGQESRLQAALDLTRALSGHLSCLDFLIQPPVVTDYFDGSGGAMVFEYVREREANNRSAIEARLKGEDVPWSMVEAIGAYGDYLASAADLSDIIVLSSPGETDTFDARRLLGEAVVKSDRPVLAVPVACRRFDAVGNALVAWNGSREANEALRQALPLLRMAASVTLFEVNRPGGEFSAADAASYLSRHGIRVSVIEESTPGPVADAILQKAREIGAAYVVLGAYGSPRVVEAVFGGVTNDMLAKSELPLLLAH